MDPGTLLESFSEADLLARVAKKDADAFAELYDRTSAVLFSIAKSVLIDSTLAEDVLQEVYLQVWDKAGVYNPALGKPISWLLAVTRNKALDRLRSTRRRETVLQQFATEAPEDASEHLATDVELKDAADLARQALSTLKEKQRQAIELALLRGLPHAEVAELMQEPLGTVKAWIRRGIIEIREQMKDHL